MSICSPRVADPEPLIVKPKIAWKLLGCSNTRGYELLAAGELDSFLDGRSRKITMESIRRYVARRLVPTEDASIDPQTRRRGGPRKSGEISRGTP
jgi:hypothetical protein